MGVIALCALVVFTVSFLRGRRDATPQGLLARIPGGDSVILSIDVRALRQAGILSALAGSRLVEEPEYKAFVLETAFDYRQDLDSILAAFHPNATYLLLRGRFNWRRLSAYAASQDGFCRNTLCRMPGSVPERKISFFPVNPDVMALAVSQDESAATNLMGHRKLALAFEVPRDPLWLAVSAGYLKDHGGLPAGTRLFAKAMEGAERIVISLGPEQDRFKAVLDVTCRTADDAALLVLQLEGVTRLLRDLIEKENKVPNPRDLSGVLAAGTFRQAGARVEGRWPVHRAFLEVLAGSSF